MLTLENVTYRYAGAPSPSLRELTLELRDGEVVGLVGASEAGKSTLCLVASGLAPRAIGGHLSGRVLLDGEPTVDRPLHELVASVGICFQNPTTQLSGVTGTVFEEVAFGTMNLAVPRDEVIERTWEALNALRIEELAERDPARLSGGQQQLVAVAGLLAMRARHLILDEPTAQLDPEGSRLVEKALERLGEGGATILIAEQRTDLLERVCTRVVALEHGRIALEGPAADVLAEARMPELGVALPARVELERALTDARLSVAEIDRALS